MMIGDKLMAEIVTEMIVPGTYIDVRSEGLIGVGSIITGNIGIVGTASKGILNTPKILSSYAEAVDEFGEYDAWQGGNSGELTLVRALEQIYNNNGAATVIAVRVASDSARKAKYYLKSSSGNCAVLTAKSEGTWGDEIKVNVFDATEDPFISKEQHASDGNQITLFRGNIKESKRNQIIVVDKTTGNIKNFNIVYGAAEPAASEVKINKNNGQLTFHKDSNSDETPKEGTDLYASYSIDKIASAKVKVIYKNITEEYNVPDGRYLVGAVNASSKLVDAENDTKPDENPVKFGKDIYEKFGTGTNQPGNNGTDAVDKYKDGLQKLEEKPVNIVLTAGLPFSITQSDIVAHCEITENLNMERIALVGGGPEDSSDLILKYADQISDDRVIFVSPAIKSKDSVSKKEVILPGSYAAAAVAGKISSLAVHVAPTNKTLSLVGLGENYSYGTLKNLVNNRVLVIQEKMGYRIVKGITTEDGAFKQITTRRIVDYAKEGIRIGSLPYIGKLNNSRVRAALRATLDGFLSRMVVDEQLTEYTLNVSATRQEEINGICRVETTLKPTFSIDYIKVVITLQ
jgi:phage tail sheath protein FI